MSIEIRIGMKSARVEQISLISSSWYQIRILTSMSLVLVEQSHTSRHLFMIAHKFSMGFRYGQLPGQSSKVNFDF